MLIKEEYPPNIVDIRRSGLKLPDTAIFCYGSTIYNPSRSKIEPDQHFHESIHERQQAQYVYPEVWWARYLGDRDFRKRMEVEAYALQLRFVKDSLGAKAAKGCLDELSENLSSEQYGLGITFYEAQTLIRKYGKA